MSEKSLTAVVVLMVIGTGISVWQYEMGRCPGGPDRCPREAQDDIPFDREVLLGLAAGFRQKPRIETLEVRLVETHGVPDGIVRTASLDAEADENKVEIEPAVHREHVIPCSSTGKPKAEKKKVEADPPARYGTRAPFTADEDGTSGSACSPDVKARPCASPAMSMPPGG